MSIQLITFAGDPIVLPKGFKWAVHRYFTTSGMMPLTTHKFSDFTTCRHHWQSGNFHLFELHLGDMKIMCHCLIKYVGS